MVSFGQTRNIPGIGALKVDNTYDVKTNNLRVARVISFKQSSGRENPFLWRMR